MKTHYEKSHNHITVPKYKYIRDQELVADLTYAGNNIVLFID